MEKIMFYEPERDIKEKLSTKGYENITVALHFHRSIELICILEGELNFRVGGAEFTAKSGEIVFVPEYFAHGTTDKSKNKVINLILPYNYYKNFKHKKIPLYYSLLKKNDINGLILDEIKTVKHYIDAGSELLLQALAGKILGLITHHYIAENKNSNDNQFVIQIINYIDKHFKERLSLSKLAKEFKYSKHHFSTIFNKVFGSSLNNYINSVRYNFVEENISGDKKVTALIFEAGFNDTSTYYKFKKKYKN